VVRAVSDDIDLAIIDISMPRILHRARTDQPLREEPLTAREQEVVKLIAEGYSTRQIEKLGMHDRVELTRYAIRRGLVDP
jgi:DNA-binding NarL/FixJ family response regulator